MFLRELISRSDVSESLLVASPSLKEGLEQWLREPLSERGRKVERALVSYVQRMSSRCTPFGLFASVSLGRVGRHLRTEVASGRELRRRTRLDHGYLQAVCDDLSALPEVRARLKYTANETLHQVGGRLHFVTARQDAGQRYFELSAVDAIDALTAHILPAAREGQRPEALVNALVKAMPELTAGDAAQFIDELIDAQVLLGSLSVPLTGREGLEVVLEQLRALELERIDTQARALETARQQLAQLDGLVGHSSAPYDALVKTLEPLGVPFERGQLVQVDVARQGDHAELPDSLVRQLLRVATLVASATPAQADPLDGFRTAFATRYEGAEVPLLEALDDEAGVGFTSEHAGHEAPLLKGVEFAPLTPQPEVRDPAWDTWVSGLLMQAQVSGNHEIVLTEAALAQKARRSNPLPESAVLCLSLFARKPGSTDPIAFWSGLAGPSSEALFGRFAALDERFERVIRAGLAAEEALRPEATFAELVHSPQGRSGNVIARPTVRACEIQILSRGGLPRSQTIQLDDLLLSIRDGRLTLRSRSTGREVVPRVTNAHNAASLGLPLYQFLATLQNEALPRVGQWSWGSHRHAPSLPRVRVGPIVIMAARWFLTHALLERLSDVNAVRALAQRLRWPRFLVARERDHTLTIDLQNDLSVETFLGSYQHRAQVLIEEDLSRLYGSPFVNEQGHFANELLVPVVALKRRTPALELAPVSVTQARQVFTPGSEWLYLRLHVAPAMADQILMHAVSQVLAWAKGTGELKRWFFLRYDEQGHHLRLRFCGSPKWLRGPLSEQLEAALARWVESRIVSRVVSDTYRREVERYGGDEAMLVAEAWFEASSDEALAVIGRLSSDEQLENRSWATFIGVHRTLRLLLGSDDEQRAALEGWRRSLFEENGGTAALESSLSTVGRVHRAWVDQLVSGVVPERLGEVASVLTSQRSILEPLAESMKQLYGQRRLTTSLQNICGALTHMHVNRMLRAQQRQQELVMYDLLLRQLRSAQGRQRT